MGVNKVVYREDTLIDLTSDTVDADHLAEGYTAHNKAGDLITGLLNCDLPTGFSNIAMGEYILQSDTAYNSTFTVTHNCGFAPDLFMFWTPTNIAQTYSCLMVTRCSQFAWRSSSYPNLIRYHGNSTTSVSGSVNTTSYGIKSMTSTTAVITSNSSSYYWRAGTYKWMAIKFS